MAASHHSFFLRLAKKLFALTLFLFGISYFVFHYVTNDGITRQRQMKPGKPFITHMLGQLSVLTFFSSIVCALAGTTDSE